MNLWLGLNTLETKLWQNKISLKAVGNEEAKGGELPHKFWRTKTKINAVNLMKLK